MSGVFVLNFDNIGSGSFSASAEAYGGGGSRGSYIDMINGEFRFYTPSSPPSGEIASYSQLTSPGGWTTSDLSINLEWDAGTNNIIYRIFHCPPPYTLGTENLISTISFNLNDVFSTIIPEVDIPLFFTFTDPGVTSYTPEINNYSNTPGTINILQSSPTVTKPYEYRFNRSAPNTLDNRVIMTFLTGAVFQPEAEPEPGLDDVTLVSFPMAMPSFVINANPPDYVDFVFTFSDIPISNFYPTTLSNTHSRYTLSQWPLAPNGSYSLMVRATYIKDSGIIGGGVAGGSGINSKVYHDSLPEGPLQFLGGGSLTTDLSLLQDKGSYAYTANTASFYSGSGVPVNSNGNDDDLYVDYVTMILYKRVSGSWVSQGNFFQSGIMFVGSGIPGNSIGYDGSFYFDVLTSTVYGPKVSGSWVGTSTYNLRRASLLSGLQAGLSNSVGFDGDFYFATDTRRLFGPKVSGSWNLSAGIALTGGSFLSGSGAPGASVGLTGDFYLDIVTGILYGPKLSDGSWTGVATSNIYRASFLSGTDANLVSNGASIGINGDFYFASDTGYLYGPKTAGAWNLSQRVSLVGGRFYSGSGVPSGSVGGVGDSYLDTVTGIIYGPKLLAGSWAGVASASLYQSGWSSGSGPPTDGSVVGAKAGGFYLDTVTKELYGPYNGTTWVGVPKVASFSGAFLFGSTGGTPPGVGVGVQGDFFYDVISGLLFGPKTLSGWSSTDVIRIRSEGEVLSGTGTGLLTASYGRVGDMYLDTATGFLYGPKTSGGWNLTTKYSLSGGRFYSDVGTPSGSVGLIGDYYYNQTTGVVIGPKLSNSSWSGAASFSIGGIPSGTGPPSESFGANGSFFYSTNESILYGPKSGTWTNSPKLRTNLAGFLTGITNPLDADGRVGDIYFNYATNELWGPKTVDGWTGGGIPLGSTGETEDSLITGQGPPSLDLGVVGSVYIDRTNLTIYGPKAATSGGGFIWPVIGRLNPASGGGSGSGGCGCGGSSTSPCGPKPCGPPCSSPCTSSCKSSYDPCSIGGKIGEFVGDFVSQIFSNPVSFIFLLIILALLYVIWKNRCRVC